MCSSCKYIYGRCHAALHHVIHSQAPSESFTKAATTSSIGVGGAVTAGAGACLGGAGDRGRPCRAAWGSVSHCRRSTRDNMYYQYLPYNTPSNILVLPDMR